MSRFKLLMFVIAIGLTACIKDIRDPTTIPIVESSPTKLPTTSTATVFPPTSTTPIDTIPDFPDVMLNLTTNLYALYLCEGQEHGEIWLGTSPGHTPQRLLADPTKSFYYPVWSPDGRYLAYVVVDSTNSVTQTMPQGENRQLEDAIWVMNLENGQTQQISQKHQRLEFTSFENQTCVPTSGILPKPLWSYDSHWLSYTDINARLYIINMITGNSQLITEDNDGLEVWSPHENALAYTTHLYKAVEMAVISDSEIRKTTFNLPSDLLEENEISGVFWGQDPSQLRVMVSKPSAGGLATALLLHLNLSDGQWSRPLTVSVYYPVVIYPAEGFACINYDQLGQFNPNTWTMLTEVKISGVDCKTLKPIQSVQGNVFLSIVGNNHKSLLVADPNDLPTSVRSLFNLEQLEMPSELLILDFSWQPRP